MKKRKNTRLNAVDYSIFSICSVLSLFMFFLFYRDLNSYTINQNEEVIATISFKENTVQRKLENRNIWEKVNLSCEIYNGDSLRTSGDSKAVAAFLENDTQINLDENSMIQLFKNKKKDFIDFVSGEIHIENTSSDTPIIIHAGTKAISILANSKAKLTAVESESNEKPVEAIIEVESGNVEITEIEIIENPKTKDVTESVVTVSAGNAVELNLEKELPAEKEIVIKPIEEIKKEPIEEHIEEIIVEEPEENEELVVEPIIEEPVKVEKIVEKKAEQKEIEKPVEEKKNVTTPSVAMKKPKEVVITEIQEKAEGQREVKRAFFRKNTWSGGYNYMSSTNLKDLFGENLKISKGTIVNVTISGVSEKDIERLIFQISTGENEWVVASGKNVVVGNSGIKANERFEYSTNMYLEKDVINTSRGSLVICYDPWILDDSILIKDFSITAKILKEPIVEIANGYKKELYFPNLKTTYSYFIDSSGKEVYDGIIILKTEEVFGEHVSLDKGKKLQIRVEGVSSRNIEWMVPQLSQTINNEWMDCIMNNNTNLLVNKSIVAKRKFNVVQRYKLKKKFESSDFGEFNIVIGLPNQKKLNGDNIEFSDLKITVEVIE